MCTDTSVAFLVPGLGFTMPKSCSTKPASATFRLSSAVCVLSAKIGSHHDRLATLFEATVHFNRAIENPCHLSIPPGWHKT